MFAVTSVPLTTPAEVSPRRERRRSVLAELLRQSDDDEPAASPRSSSPSLPSRLPGGGGTGFSVASGPAWFGGAGSGLGIGEGTSLFGTGAGAADLSGGTFATATPGSAPWLGSGAGGGGAGALGSLGPIGAIAAAVALTKGLEHRNPDNFIGKLGQTFNAPSLAQIKEDPKVGLTTLLGIPFINSFIMNDDAKRAQPEWERIFGIG